MERRESTKKKVDRTASLEIIGQVLEPTLHTGEGTHSGHEVQQQKGNSERRALMLARGDIPILQWMLMFTAHGI
jgi:hypothetical protein